MLFPGTEMHMITFGFICVELVLLLYLCIFKSARPENNKILLDILLLVLLIFYNLTGGLLPDPELPGSYFVQEALAYTTGFLTPCYFPYYVYRTFQLQKMGFHVKKGVWYFLVFPFIIFTVLFYATGNLNKAKNILVIPVCYAIWVIISVSHSVKIKYGTLKGQNAMEELAVLLICLAPWVALPLIAYFDVSQPAEVLTTNTGFLLLFGLHLRNNVRRLKADYYQLQLSEAKLQTWNEALQLEVEKRTKELEMLSREEKFKIKCKEFSLTQRENEIALLVVKGNTYKQVAEELYIAERTVAKHIQNIFEKINVSNKTEMCNKLST